ncbi:MAG: molecular chaperone HtpG [Bacteroidales bacterium]|nr:molecular chaperone HtpG [Bacteroidales bacterium]
MKSGKIGVTTENIFPVIKKFLYSDHEIFLRELVSNAIDATQKLKTLTSVGEFKGELGDLRVTISVDKEKGTLTVSDNGVGMDSDDIEKYINQIAFSGAEEFLTKYKDSANSIIGHFGLGFYSAFMVSKNVEINTLSYKDGSKPVRWSCDGSPEYVIEEGSREERGTDVILYIDDDSKEFLESTRIETLLKKYCRFLPIPVIFGKEQEWKDGKYIDTERDKIINSVEPLWSRKPSELKDEDYIKFYHELNPVNEDPMFWIHLNVDYPFTLTGILYFPKIKSNIDIQKNRIQLYCNQVFVTDQVEGVVPEFMMLMQGVIDSPDIPLNVSRSYLQADGQVKKISSYISKKVSERLDKMFKNNRSDFQQKWDDIKLFIEYGMLSDEKFCDSAMKYALLKDVDGNYFTFDEYLSLVKSCQTDKDGNIVYLYSTNEEDQYSYIESARNRGYNILLMDGQLDNHFIGLLEHKLDKTRIVRVDSDIIDRLIVKEDIKKVELTTIQKDIVSFLFKSQIPTIDNVEFVVNLDSLGSTELPAIITQNEFMRRMKEMSAMQPGLNFYGEMPDSFVLTINTANETVKTIVSEVCKSIEDKILPIINEIDEINKKISSTEVSEDEKSTLKTKVSELKVNEESIISDYAKTQDIVKQIIDLSLLQSNLLRGENLGKFIRRSYSMM